MHLLYRNKFKNRLYYTHTYSECIKTFVYLKYTYSCPSPYPSGMTDPLWDNPGVTSDVPTYHSNLPCSSITQC